MASTPAMNWILLFSCHSEPASFLAGEESAFQRSSRTQRIPRRPPRRAPENDGLDSGNEVDSLGEEQDLRSVGHSNDWSGLADSAPLCKCYFPGSRLCRRDARTTSHAAVSGNLSLRAICPNGRLCVHPGRGGTSGEARSRSFV